ncbi:MAG TPA: glycosyltransferase [Bryobacteraceae bacterium]|jgi:glycosyltransferase involved in cell wall biosynthesis|nr:glycosyltransferase [Bryobacteraceae bacterium]
MRCAIVHYWLMKMRGGEKVLEALCRLLPDADIFTLFYEPESISPIIRSHRVTASFLNPLRRKYRSLLPLMPLAVEHLDLRGYDLVISSESGPAKGVLTSSATRHICYCHSPMRYLWDLYPDYFHDWTRSGWKRAAMAPLAHYLRLWDYSTASRVDTFLANSYNVQRRIEKAYRRESQVIYPPVAVDDFHYAPAEDYYLAVSELTAYKRIEDAIRCCSRMGRKLKVVGQGAEYRRLKNMAGPSVEFCGNVPDGDLRELYARCRAFLMPGEEDFGISAVEALASGKPVIALGRGGVMESSPLPELFYHEPGSGPLEAAIRRFEAVEDLIDHESLRKHSRKFSEQRFASQMRAVIDGSRPSTAAREERRRLAPLAFRV